VIGLFVTIPGVKRQLHRRVDISVEISGPHGLAVRFIRVRRTHRSVHRIPHPTFSDDRETPLYEGAGRAENCF
jgi:hypothetical protein